jgi:hypothetical protein
LMLVAARWTLTQRLVCAVVLGLGLGVALLVETTASRAAEDVPVAEGETEAPADGDGEYGGSGVCSNEPDGEGEGVAPPPGLLSVAEGLGDGVGDGVGEGVGDGEGDGDGDGEGDAEAVTGSGRHCWSVLLALLVAAATVDEDAASAPSCRLVNTPRVRNPPVNKLSVAALTYPKRMRIALSALLVRGYRVLFVVRRRPVSGWVSVLITHIPYHVTYAPQGRLITDSGTAGSSGLAPKQDVSGGQAVPPAARGPVA